MNPFQSIKQGYGFRLQFSKDKVSLLTGVKIENEIVGTSEIALQGGVDQLEDLFKAIGNALARTNKEDARHE